jgi:hypothetical protein
VLDQGLAGLVLQLLKRRRGDVDGQGFGLGVQLGRAFAYDAEHNLTHAGVSLSFRFHPWAAKGSAGVLLDTGNRPDPPQ